MNVLLKCFMKKGPRDFFCHLSLETKTAKNKKGLFFAHDIVYSCIVLFSHNKKCATWIFAKLSQTQCLPRLCFTVAESRYLASLLTNPKSKSKVQVQTYD